MTERDYLAGSEPGFRPKVFFSWPTLGKSVNKQSAIVAAQARMHNAEVEIVGAMSLESSNLERNFNGSLMHALGLRDAGQATHFAMHHADVVPQGDWLDGLWAQMQATGADIVSAVIPIKEHVPNPRTSTAVAAVGDIWHPSRFVHCWDRANLPDTFTIDDVGDPATELLLINTGCWLADLRRPWWTAPDPLNPTSERFAFHRRNRIVTDPADGRHVEQTSTEDWLLSHFLHAQGAKVAATWAVSCEHHGEYAWPNQVLIPPAWQTCRGWLTDAEGEQLQQLVANQKVLELGSYAGRSTVCMAQTARMVVAVDWCRGDADTRKSEVARDTEAELRANLRRCHADHKVRVVRKRFEDLTDDELTHPGFDVVFIDGQHDADSVERDTRIALRTGAGTLVYHDANYDSVQEGARRAGVTIGRKRDDTSIGVAYVTFHADAVA